MMNLQTTLTTNQEHCIAELKAEYNVIVTKMQVETAELCSEVADLKIGLNFTSDEIRDIKEVKKKHTPAEQEPTTADRINKLEQN